MRHSESLSEHNDGIWGHLEPPQEEIVVMQAVLDGYKDQAIARRLDISIITVRRRVGRYLERTGARNRIQGAVLGVLQGWLTLDPALVDRFGGRKTD